MSDKRDQIAAELEQIRKRAGGLLKPEDVVEFARDPETALHNEFTWDDTKAAHEYRLWQARTVINVNVIVLPNSSEPVPVYVSLTSDRTQPGGGYRSVADVLKNPTHYEQMLADALRDLQVFQRRYAAIKELAPVLKAAAKVQKKQDAKQVPARRAAAHVAVATT